MSHCYFGGVEEKKGVEAISPRISKI